jgi:hypothetical protein
MEKLWRWSPEHLQTFFMYRALITWWFRIDKMAGNTWFDFQVPTPSTVPCSLLGGLVQNNLHFT